MSLPGPTWTWDGSTLTHLGSGQSMEIAADLNPELCELLSRHYAWLCEPLPEWLRDYSLIPDGAVRERRIVWTEATADPPALTVERRGEMVRFEVVEEDDAPAWQEYMPLITQVMRHAGLSAWTDEHSRRLAVLLTRAQRAKGLY